MEKCRLCINEIDHESKAFDNQDDAQIEKLIAKNIQIEVGGVDTQPLSSKICFYCFSQLDAFRSFCLYVEKQQRIYWNSINRDLGSFAAENGKYAADLETLSIPASPLIDNNVEILLDIKDVLAPSGGVKEGANEVDALNYGDDLQDNQLIEDTASLISGEGEDSFDDIPLKDLVSESPEIENKQSKCILRSKVKEVQAKDSSSRKSRCGKRVSLKKPKCAAKYKRNEDVVNAIMAQKGKNESIIGQHLRLKCDICEEPMQNFLNLKKHFRQAHNTRGYVTCCDKPYYKSASLADHIQLHIDPDAFKCQECGKNLRSKSCLEIHIRNKHVNKEQLRFVCSECGRRFAHSTNLKAHFLTHVTKREFVCEFCEKGFKTNYSLSVHVLALHKDIKPFVCDICGEDFKMKASFDRHIAEHKGIKKTKPAVQCSVCEKWLVKYNLKKHMDTHDKTEVNCPKCDKLLSSKSALTSHLKYVHSTRPSLKCTFCEKTFKQRSNLQEHIAMHTGTKDHSCPHCDREFRSKANMYVHIKRNHVNEWMQAQIARTKLPPDSLENDQ